MADPSQLLPHGGRAPDPDSRPLYGYVSTRQPAPGSFTDPLFVVCPHDSDHAITIHNWPVIHGATLPALGADVLLIYDDLHNPRVAWWSGVYTNPDPGV